MVRGSYNLGFMYEFGLGVHLDYRKALMFYDRASSTVADVDQILNGLPIQLLVSIAKARYMYEMITTLSFGRLFLYVADTPVTSPRNYFTGAKPRTYVQGSTLSFPSPLLRASVLS